MEGSVLITGASGGLGQSFITEFLSSPYASKYHAVYTARNPAKTEFFNTLPSTHNFSTLPLNLNSLAAVREGARLLNQRVANKEIPPIRVLILNAASANFDGFRKSDDGYEVDVAINYLANVLFILLILQSIHPRGRIILLSAAIHDGASWMNKGVVPNGEHFTEIETAIYGGPTDEESGGPVKAGKRRYGLSKLLLMTFMHELHRRLSSTPSLSNISLIGLDPGGMGHANLATKGPLLERMAWKHIFPLVQDVSVRLWPNGTFRTYEKSAHDLILAGFEMSVEEEHSSAIYLNGSERTPSSEESRNEEKQRRLWSDTLKVIKLEEGDTVLKDWQ